jgi:hypothetical protein
MGMVLKSRYEQVGNELGSTGRMKLAMLTKISSIKAAEIEDSADNLKIVDDAIAQIRKGM